MSKELFYSLLVTVVKHVPYNDKVTKEPKLMCTMSVMTDLVDDSRTVGRGFMDMDLSTANNGEVALRLQRDLRDAISKGYDYVHITPYSRHEARSRGDGKAVVVDYDLVGYGNISSITLDAKQPVTDVKQTDSKQPATDSKQPVKS